MTVYERQNLIMEHLKKNKFSNVKELAKLVWSSQSSVRRDIKELEARGLVNQIYGGVMLPEYQNSVIPLDLRDSTFSAEKEKIAKCAAGYIFNGATVLMDGSSTVRRIVKYLDRITDLKIVTNNLRLLNDCKTEGIKIYCTGGLYNAESQIFIGGEAEDFIRKIHADLLFFSARALSDDGVISDVSEQEISLRRVMMEHSDKKIFLCDSSKIGVKKTFSLCNAKDLDGVICDLPEYNRPPKNS